MKNIFFAISLLTGFALTSEAGFYMNQDQALELAFSTHSVIERKSIFLTSKQVEAIQTLANAKVESEIVNFYIGKKDGRLIGYAFFEQNIVRTMPQTYMVVLDPEGKIKSVEMLAFYEPEEYLPSEKWMTLFKGKDLEDQLWVKRGLRNITGSTLTTQAIAQGVRKIIATFKVAIKN